MNTKKESNNKILKEIACTYSISGEITRTVLWEFKSKKDLEEFENNADCPSFWAEEIKELDEPFLEYEIGELENVESIEDHKPK